MLWKEKYEWGVPEIDEQHKELFRRVEAFLQALRASDSWEEKVQQVNETVDFMKGYVVEHFRDEEAYQLAIGYPDYTAHCKAHNGMAAYVAQVSKECEKNGCTEQLMQQFAGRLLAWLINHVAADDQRIALFAAEKRGRTHEE